MCGYKAVERRASGALRQPRAEVSAAERAGIGDTDGRTVEVSPREHMSQALAILRRCAATISCDFNKKIAWVGDVRERIGRRSERLDHRHVDLHAELLAVDAVNVVEPGENCRVGIGVAPLRARELEVADRTKIDFRHGAGTLRHRCVQLGNQRLVHRGAVAAKCNRGATAHGARRDNRIREAVNDRRRRTDKAVTRRLDGEQLLAVPDQASRHAVGDDDSCPRTRLAGELATVRRYAACKHCTGFGGQ